MLQLLYSQIDDNAEREAKMTRLQVKHTTWWWSRSSLIGIDLMMKSF